MTLPINGDLRPTDPLARKRQLAADARTAGSAGTAPSGGHSDHAAILSTHPEAVRSYVQLLKTMNPEDLHRVEELRERIQSGAYKADPDEMAEHIARQLIQERRGNRGA